jgi:hypothetical protein
MVGNRYLVTEHTRRLKVRWTNWNCAFLVNPSRRRLENGVLRASNFALLSYKFFSSTKSDLPLHTQRDG